MFITNISKEKFESFKQLKFKNSFINTEASLFLVPDKENNKKYKILKKFNVTQGNSFNNKILAINTLNDYKKEINIPEFVFPDSLCTIDSNLKGYMMEYVKGQNLSNYLFNPKIAIEEKIYYLKKIAKVLNDLKKLRQKKEFNNFFINDLHEDNIIITGKREIKFVDLDSCRISNNHPSPSKYLCRLKQKQDSNDISFLQEKYIPDSYYFESLVPTENTDNYCLTIMLLNTLYQKDISTISLEDYYKYIEYLEDIKVNKNLIKIFYNLYTNQANENCLEYLDSIDSKIYQECRKYQR